jgi:hypothetical protein
LAVVGGDETVDEFIGGGERVVDQFGHVGVMVWAFFLNPLFLRPFGVVNGCQKARAAGGAGRG